MIGNHYSSAMYVLEEEKNWVKPWNSLTSVVWVKHNLVETLFGCNVVFGEKWIVGNVIGWNVILHKIGWNVLGETCLCETLLG